MHRWACPSDTWGQVDFHGIGDEPADNQGRKWVRMRTGPITAALLCAGALCALAAPPRPPMPTAYFEGQVVSITFERPAKGQRTLDFGPWQLGISSRNERPRDRRLNLYVVIPGAQHHIEGWDEYDHNMIVNAVPENDDAVEWDVYWVLVLDPHLRQDLRSERDLLLAAQERFTPGDLFEFDDIPSHTVLREYLHIDALPGLARFRQKDGSVPRLLMLPAGGVARIRVESPSATAAK